MTDFKWTPAGYYKVMQVDLNQLCDAMQSEELTSDPIYARGVLHETLKYANKIIENAHRCLEVLR